MLLLTSAAELVDPWRLEPVHALAAVAARRVDARRARRACVRALRTLVHVCNRDRVAERTEPSVMNVNRIHGRRQ